MFKYFIQKMCIWSTQAEQLHLHLHFMKSYINKLTLFFILINFFCVAQKQKEYATPENIKSVQFEGVNNRDIFPIVAFGEQITLQFDDLNADEHYKYVDPHEVYPRGDYLFVNDVNEDEDSDFELPMLPAESMDIPPQLPMPRMPMEETEDKTNINFNPVIKVITDGNDNSQGIDPSTIIQPNGYSPQIQINPQNPSSYIPNNSQQIQGQEPEEHGIPQEASAINFNEPIIVKKQ